MSGTTAKRVVLYRFDRQPAEGFVTSTSFDAAMTIEWMSLDGNLQTLTYSEVKALCFISESGPPNLFSEYTAFDRRPKLPGLWTRFELKDGDHLEGILSHNLADWPLAGFLAIPPKAGSLRQRAFLPRLAVVTTEFRGIIGKRPATPRKRSPAKTLSEEQLQMFD